jgi:hypothetical protein
MFEEAFLKVGERLGVLQAKVVLALAGGAMALAVLVAAGVYIWLNPLLHCRQQSALLFFGTAIRHGEHVRHLDGSEWHGFVESAIVPRLPDGFTILEGQGFYRSASDAAAMRENTYILMVAHRNEAEINARLATIVEDYKSRFQQESVLRLDQCGVYKF